MKPSDEAAKKMYKLLTKIAIRIAESQKNDLNNKKG
jgi:hypothetical protein